METDSIRNERDFASVKDKCAKGVDAPIIVMSGGESMFKKALINSIHSYMFDSETLSDMNYNVYYDKSDVSEDSPLEAVFTLPFVSKKRLVIIHNYLNFTNTCDFLEYAEKPVKHTLLILTTESETKNDPLYKSKNKNIYFIDFPVPQKNDIRLLIKTFVSKKDKTISPSAIEYILDNISQEYSVISGELERMCEYLGKNKYIDIDDIKDFSHDIKKADIFDFVNALLLRDAKKTFTLMHHLEKEPHTSAPLLMTNFMTLFYLKIFPPNTPINDISSITGINSYALTKKKEEARHFSLAEVARCISELTKISKLSVTAPLYVVKARFNIFVFNVIRKKYFYAP